jgi:hypothetical protein
MCERVDGRSEAVETPKVHAEREDSTLSGLAILTKTSGNSLRGMSMERKAENLI